MTLKYYGKSDGYGACILSIIKSMQAYKQEAISPSYCVWIVPGTVDADGNPIE